MARTDTSARKNSDSVLGFRFGKIRSLLSEFAESVGVLLETDLGADSDHCRGSLCSADHWGSGSRTNHPAFLSELRRQLNRCQIRVLHLFPSHCHLRRYSLVFEGDFRRYYYFHCYRGFVVVLEGIDFGETAVAGIGLGGIVLEGKVLGEAGPAGKDQVAIGATVPAGAGFVESLEYQVIDLVGRKPEQAVHFLGCRMGFEANTILEVICSDLLGTVL